MTDTFSYLLFPKLFCQKKLSLVAKNPYRPFFHVWDWSILPLLENELYKRVFNIPFTSGHSNILIFQKKWSHVISRDVLESFHVYQISIRFHPLCQSHSKETIFIWKKSGQKTKKQITIQSKLVNKRGCWPAVCLMLKSGHKRSVMYSCGLQLQLWQLLWKPQLRFFSKLTEPKIQNSCQQYYKGVVGQRRGNKRIYWITSLSAESMYDW